MRDGRKRQVVLYGREGCHLCEEARTLLAGLARRDAGIAVREVDIEADEELLRRYLERIPVIAVDGEIVSELVPDPGALETALLHTQA